MTAVLELENLAVDLERNGEYVGLVRGVSLSVRPGEIYGVVGESGSGKSLTARAITHALPRGLKSSGVVRFRGEETQSYAGPKLRSFLAHDIGMVFQDPRAHVNPVQRLDSFLMEAMRFHGDTGTAKSDRRRTVGDVLEAIGVRDPVRVLRSYPHELSGGLLQRVMIASVLLMRPQVILADEPTTALDVTTQAEVIKTLVGMRDDYDMSVVLITHDLDLAASVCDRISVMYAGSVVETRPARELYDDARHPYSQGLLLSRPRLNQRKVAMPTMPGRPTAAADTPLDECAFVSRCWAADDACRMTFPTLVEVGSGTARCLHVDATMDRSQSVSWDSAPPTSGASGASGADSSPVLQVRELRKVFSRGRRQPLVAVDSTSFDLRAGESLAIIGESGSGKTTTARMILGLERPTSGHILVNGEDWTRPAARMKARRGRARFAQMIFQDPLGSLDPSQSILAAMVEVRQVHFDESRPTSDARAREIADLVGLGATQLAARPLNLSGGQRQRSAIARALAVEPKLLVLDEPASALDVSIQASVINLFNRLRSELELSYLLISHDLGVVAQLADEGLVMRQGEIVERGSITGILRSPSHPYTQELEASIPQPAWA
jgi:peptide/nickel transport system ATP-binding protein